MALCQITRDPIDVGALISAVQAPTDGALCVFSGVVRADPGPGGETNRVQVLEYDAYPEMAEAKLAEVAAEVAERWPEQKIAIAHRIGRLEVGEASVVIAVASPHRHESFEACHYAINRVKSTAPIWKKEIYQSGEEWVEGTLPGATVDRADSVPTSAGG
ncbi:MAG: molybdenum cofactor biosynthesis protein MoaE [Dehalococcoidia bacterium]|nr:molybdenum cofactor biosynthesis protein MoaE [Dehalococcoidia bacterium]